MDDRILKEIQDQIASLFLPTPAAALDDRPHLPVRVEESKNPRGHAIRVPNRTVDVPTRVYTSEALNTKGYTLQNVFLRMTIKEDTNWAVLPAGQRDDLYVFCTLEGSYGSAWCELARSGILPYAGPGAYAFGMVGTDASLATMIRFRIFARSQHETGTRVLRVFLDGMLAAGYQF